MHIIAKYDLPGKTKKDTPKKKDFFAKNGPHVAYPHWSTYFWFIYFWTFLFFLFFFSWLTADVAYRDWLTWAAPFRAYNASAT